MGTTGLGKTLGSPAFGVQYAGQVFQHEDLCHVDGQREGEDTGDEEGQSVIRRER